MKKVLLSAVAAVYSLASFGQCDNVNADAAGFFDDFNAVDPITNEGRGLYFWDDRTDGDFAVANSRTGNGVLGLTISQGFNGFEPTGVSFGDSNGDGTGVANVMDLSNDATFSVDVENTGDSTIKFRLALQDIDGNTLDSYAAALSDPGGFANAWQYAIETVVAPGGSTTFTGTFAGGTQSDYGTSSFVTNLDFTKVTAVMITVINTSQDASYNTLGLVDQTVEISNFKVGACPDPVGLSSAKAATYEVYPNPATDNVKFSKELSNVTVFDALGNVVETSATSSNLNVTEYNTGIYFIKSEQGTTQFVVE